MAFASDGVHVATRLRLLRGGGPSHGPRPPARRGAGPVKATAVVSFVVCLAAFTLIGVLSAVRRKATPRDYLVADRAVAPWLAALSAVATNNSGFMFIGLVGFTYRMGFQAVWISAGWVVGDLLAWLFVYRRVRRLSGRLDLNSLPALLGTGDARTVRPVVVLAGLLTFVFLGAYAAAQLEAGSAALQSLLGWPAWSGVVLGAGIVVAYCFAGGLRASIWTDAAQSFVMLGAMAWILVTAADTVGGPSQLAAALASQDPALARWVPAELAFGLPLYALGFVVGGFGVIGQPHIVIRAMSLDRPEDVSRARLYYFLWFVPFTFASFAVGLYARALLPELSEVATAGLSPEQIELARVQASERALPELAQHLLPDFWVGLALAGLFAATISTADSQVLACSAAITQDALPRLRRSYLASKLSTLAVAALALGIALTAGRGVFSLVLVAWSALAASLGALLLLRLRGGPAGPWRGPLVAVAGVATVVAWERSAWADDLFKLLPGLGAALLVAVLVSWTGRALRRLEVLRPPAPDSEP